ncbi:MAG: hypothetical protein VX668_02320 [Planctomycetota bacterium]|nr:hypothetical protein [Planctomycetota bacterium]
MHVIVILLLGGNFLKFRSMVGGAGFQDQRVIFVWENARKDTKLAPTYTLIGPKTETDNPASKRVRFEKSPTLSLT